MTERTRFARRGSSGALMAGLLIACALLIPATALGDECHSVMGPAGTVQFHLPPSVGFALSQIPPEGTVLYRSQPYVVDYLCTYTSGPAKNQPMLTTLGDFTPLRNALRDSGLALDIIVDGNEAKPWSPKVLESVAQVFPEFFPIGVPFDRTLPADQQRPQHATIVIQLSVKSRKVTPGRYPVPGTTLIKLISDFTGTGNPGIFLTTSPTRLQYIPDTCIGDVGVDNLVQFDRVVATAGYMGTLPQQRPYNVTARINPSCSTGSLTTVRPGEGPDQEFYMPLTATFTPMGTERLSSDGRFIFLRNEEGQENGLQMQITDPAGQPVILNQAVVPPKGNFGTLHGSILSLRNTYAAELSPTGSADGMKLGKFTTQVMVNVRFE